MIEQLFEQTFREAPIVRMYGKKDTELVCTFTITSEFYKCIFTHVKSSNRYFIECTPRQKYRGNDEDIPEVFFTEKRTKSGIDFLVTIHVKEEKIQGVDSYTEHLQTHLAAMEQIQAIQDCLQRQSLLQFHPQ